MRRGPKPNLSLDLPTSLEALAQAFDEGELEEALELAKGVLAEHPDSVEALQFLAAAQLELGDLEQAIEGYEKALRLAPNDVQVLLGAADLFIAWQGEDRASVERGLALCAKASKRLRKAADDEARYHVAVLEGIGLNQLGACEQALERLDDALALMPDSHEALLERAIALFELCRFREARKAFEAVLARADDEPWAHHYLGLLAEREGDGKRAERHFATARKLAPDEFVEPATLSEEAFRAAVEAAIEKLPAHAKAYLDNAIIAVEPFPSDEDLLASRPPLSPTILGVFRGTPIGERSVTSAMDHVTASIVLYQKNLERFATTRTELIEQIGITVMHEVGHLLGLDEDDLWERGLD